MAGRRVTLRSSLVEWCATSLRPPLSRGCEDRHIVRARREETHIEGRPPRHGATLSGRGEAEGHDFAVAELVLPPLGAEQGALPGPGVATGLDELLPADHLGGDEAALHVGMNPPG